jgi:hypothetical protein
MVIEHLRDRVLEASDACVAYLYCNYKEQGQTTENLVATLLRQVIRVSKTLPENIVEFYTKHNAKGRAPVQEALQHLQAMISKASQVFIVIDAFDELSEPVQSRMITDVLPNLLLSPHVKVLITSRHIAGIREEFPGSKFLERQE